MPEHIGHVEGTWGSETSQYPQEEKATAIRELWRAKAEEAKPRTRDSRQALRKWGCGAVWLVLRTSRESESVVVSRRTLEGPA